MKSKLYVFCNRFVLVVFLVSSLGFLCCDSRENRLLHHRIHDLELRLSESRQRIDTFFIRESIPVYRERVIEVDRSVYKKNLADKQLIKELGLRLKDVEAENVMLRGMRDTVYLGVVVDSLAGELQDTVMRYQDEWCDFAYYEDKKRLEYFISDSLTTYISREYRHKLLWWKWGLKGYSVTHVNHNPHVRVHYDRYIRVKK